MTADVATVPDTATVQDPALLTASDGGWPDWALPQLQHAVRLTYRIEARRHRTALAPELYRAWFNPIVTAPGWPSLTGHPLVGVYRCAHAGTTVRLQRDGLTTVHRNDVIGRDGWWRTWGDSWRPGAGRAATVRLVLTPRPDVIDQFVRTLTTALLGESTPWLLACPTDPRRLRRSGAAVLHVADPDALSPIVRHALHPLLLAATPPLCLPLQAGMALTDNPDNGLSFGEHRCHLIALALRAGTPQAPLRSIADVFSAHGIDPRRPHESRAR